MACSEARLAANRRNAQKSSGPKTPEGKAKSRLNAFQHGMAGDGDLLLPGEDEATVARRSAAFARELGAVDESGGILARRAALLSVRMERLADHEQVAVAAKIAQARDEFDAERAGAIEELTAELEGDDAPAARAILESDPDGLVRLVEVWDALRDRIERDDSESQFARDRALQWLDPGNPEADRPSDQAIVERIEAEINRLDRLAGSLAGTARAIDRGRDRAGILASFDPSREASLARRYEAAAERGFYRAIRAIAENNKARGIIAPTPHPHPPTPVAPTIPAEYARPLNTPPSPPPAPSPSPSTNPAPLGSFRAGVANPAPAPTKPSTTPADRSTGPSEARPKRPDLARSAGKHAKNRR